MATLPLVRLGEVLVKSEDWVAIQPDGRYREVTVRLWGKGVVERRVVPGSEIAASRRLVVRAGQFIMSRIDARNGAFGVVPDSLDGAVVSNDFPVFTAKPQAVLPRFLHWLSKTPGFVDACRRASEGTTNRVRLVEERFLAIEVPLPALEEQRRIVARVEELAAKIDEARALRRAAEIETLGVMRAAMRQALGPHGSYQEVRLEQACAAIIDNLHSNPVYAEDGVPCVRSPDVGWGQLCLETALRTGEEEYLRRTARGEPSQGDIVLVREGGGTGKAALVEKGQRFSLGQRVMLLRPDTSAVLPKFFLYQVLSPSVYEEQILPLCKGSASPHLNIASLRIFRFLLPTLGEQTHIVAHLDELGAKLDAPKRLQAETAAELGALMPTILDRAFRGEL